MKSEDTASISLRLTDIPHPRSGRRVRFFEDVPRAMRHLRNHVLSHPECLAWAALWPPLAEEVDLSNGDARWHAATATQQESARWQGLYDQYAAAVRQACADAAAVGWHAPNSPSSDQVAPVTVAFGVDAVLVVIECDRVVVTAMVPGQGSAQRVSQEKQQLQLGQKRSLWREAGGMRRGHEPRARGGCAPDDVQAQWSEAQRFFYRVFRPAVQFIRQCHHRQRNAQGHLLRQDYALLKDVLGPMSKLTFEMWSALRQTRRPVEEVAQP